MMKRIITLFTGFSASILTIGAVTVHTTPGRLAEALDQVTISDRILTLTGTIGTDDYDILRSVEGVDRLDMSGLHLTASPLRPGLIEEGPWPESTILPAYALFASSFTEVILPPTLTAIKEGAFAGSRIKNISIPEGIISIADHAFYGAENLETITLPTTLTAVGAGAFDGCSALRTINIEDTKLHVLKDRVFARTRSLKDLHTSDITEIGRESLFGSGLKNVDLPTVRKLGPYALAGMPNLEKVTIKRGAKISEGLFMDDPMLSSIDGLPSVVPPVFAAECGRFDPKNAISGATSVGDFAFADTKASKFTFSQNLKQIGSNAFTGCTSIYEIDARPLAGFTPDVAKDAFSGMDVSDIHLIVASGCESIWEKHPVWKKFHIISATYDSVEIIPESPSELLLAVTREGITTSYLHPGLTIEIFSLDGRLITTAHSDASQITISMNSLPHGPMVVLAKASDGTVRSLKIIN